jgi:ATP-dependent DNA helicase Rep
VIISLAERGDDAEVATLSTLHAGKGPEWPQLWLASIGECLLPFKTDAEAMTPEVLGLRLQ